MTHDELIHLHKALGKRAPQPHVRAPQVGAKRDRHSEPVAEVTLGTLLRRHRTYDRPE